ncbi:dihydroorotate dehydrogenase [Mobilicoccus caccae]|uniref:Dihydroorotate dehydrogenase n=1 Tax=Mobilicoccus caccae TaxID=1859295 RepID=A0ABQ6IPR4_9MICO|nr:dihydroorotate dehydrogenase [Mobilicoccus caccae]GMA39905.1 dihydroorotate dehydrogenase B (NAD(+)), catalytic subunit [Mobilicoccus caccae]
MFDWLKGEKKGDAGVPEDSSGSAGSAEASSPGASPDSGDHSRAELLEKARAAVDLGVDLAGSALPNPVMTASGCAANGRELDRFFDVSELGAFVTKTVMAQPRSGRGTPRMAETASGMLNSIGLQGPGIEAFCAQDLPWLAERGAKVIVSIAGHDAEEFAHVARVLRDSDAAGAVAGVEVNISCPNVANRGLVFSCDPASSAQVVSAVVAELPSQWPAFAKLTADVTDIVGIARAALDSGAQGLTAINTLLGIRIDTRAMRPHLGGITGGLSGPAIRPVAVRAVWQLRAAMLAGAIPTAPIIGVGGIGSGEDALEFLAAGASAVQVGTVTFHDPSAPLRVRDELALALHERGIDSAREIVGAAHG